MNALGLIVGMAAVVFLVLVLEAWVTWKAAR